MRWKVARHAACIMILFLAPTTSQAEPAGGSVTEELIHRLQAQPFTAAEQALADIVANGDIDAVALNRARFLSHQSLVNLRIKTGEVTNQKGSGRCWMFAGFNVLRLPVIRKYKLKSFEFSENYLLFWDKLEKSNFFLQNMIDLADAPLDDRYVQTVLDDPLGDGGWWTYFVDLVKKYGVVPKEAMPETFNSSSTGRMNAVLTLKLKEMGLELRELARSGASRGELHKRRESMLGEIYRLLVLNLGRPPEQFVWRYETTDSTAAVSQPVSFTPRAFLEEAIGIDLDAYVALFDYPGKEYYKPYALELSRNIYDRPDFTVLNVPVDTLRACVLKSVLDSTAVWFACDVGQENYGAEGVMALGIYNYEEIYGTRFGLPRKDLIELGLITPNHAMTFVGVDTLDARPVKWLVENSWGGERGDEGLWYMYDDWFDRYLFGVIVNRRYVSRGLWEMSRQKPLVLPPWDPMYGLNNLQLVSCPRAGREPPTASPRNRGPQ
jgi:bleomycin hydrolase